MSTTGIDRLVINKKYAIVYTDNTCPNCGYRNSLFIENKRFGKYDYRLRYICSNCEFICPIKYNENGNINPLYDNSVNRFINNFGKHIKERIIDLNKK